MITLSDIEDAQTILEGRMLRTPMLPAPKLSELTGAEVFVKYENLQVTNSFKERGALNKLASLPAADRARGVIAMSAGNHAQAVAYHAARLGIAATIVMPVTTPSVKIAATRAYGADGGAAWRNRRGSAGARRGHAGRAGPDLHPPLRRPADHRRAGHDRASRCWRIAPISTALVMPIGGGGLIAGNAIAAKAINPQHRDRRRRGRTLSLDVECAERRGSALRRGRRSQKASR